MIACIGESVIDYIDGKPFMGGGILNTARAAAANGACVSFLGETSADENGLAVLETLINEGIMFDPLLCNSSLPTLVSRASITSGGVEYSFNSKEATAFENSSKKLLSALRNNSLVEILCTGSCAFSHKKSRDEIRKTVEEYKEKKVVYFDPNIRISQIDDDKSFKSDFLEFIKMCHIVKLSDEDLAYTGFSPESLAETVLWGVVLTLGKDGSIWFGRDGKVIRQPGIVAEHFEDSVGCGDTYGGSILAYLDKNKIYERSLLTDENIKKMMVFAAENAALNCSYKGFKAVCRK